MLLINSKIIDFPSILLQLNKAKSPHSKNLQITYCFVPWKNSTKTTTTTPRSLIKVSSSSSSSSENRRSQTVTEDPVELVRSFYAGINRHDLASVGLLIAENCVYEDLMFSHPFRGRKAFLEAYKKFIDSTSMDLQLVIDDITSSTNMDSSTVGAAWHFEWKGKIFPYSKGCSFYRLEMVDGKLQIVYGRDIVEPSIKLGEAALV
ncbi:hypothetical protein PTKIN_Ptkin14bG0223900 [Pterospermum kingtungense]